MLKKSAAALRKGETKMKNLISKKQAVAFLEGLRDGEGGLDRNQNPMHRVCYLRGYIIGRRKVALFQRLERRAAYALAGGVL
jgi:hypothetical protein